MAGESDEPDTLPGSVDEMTRGVDSVLGREVAMVSLPPARGEALTVRTEQVRRLAALHHPNLIEVYDVDGLAEDTESTLVLQSVDGHSLDAVVESAPWPAVSVAHVGAQVADGLAHAHAHGVLHGGIGPASLVVDETLHAWLTGFTAALRPAPTATPTAADGGPAVSSPTEDVVALGAALRALLDTSTAVPAVLDDALRAMTAGRCDARTAASALTDAAETCAHGDAAGGVVPMAVYSARISTSRSGTPDATGPASGPTPSSGSGPASPSVPSPVPAAAAAAAAAAVAAQQAAGPARPTSPPTGSPTPITAASSARRSGRQAHRSLRVAALGAATMAVAVASSAVLWAANSFSAPLPAPTGAAQGSPAVVADPALGQVTAPPAGVDTGVAVPGDARPPLLDVSTLGANEESPSRVAATSDRAVDTAPSGGSWFEHGPTVHEPPDRWYPPYRPPWVPPRPTTTAPPSTTTTVPPTTTTTPKPTTTTPKPTTTTPKPTTTTPKPTTTKPTTTTNSTGTSGQGVAGQGSGAAQGAGEAATGTGDAAPGASGAGVAPSARAAGPVSPTPAVVAAGR